MLVFLSIRLPIDYTGKPVPGPWPLAIRFEQLIRDGVARDQADLARLALVSRARVTQLEAKLGEKNPTERLAEP